jgi:hypothetical protein
MGGIGAWVAGHRKLLVSVAGAAVTVAIQAGWTTNVYVSALILIATAAGVYRAPNVPAPEPKAGAGTASRSRWARTGWSTPRWTPRTTSAKPG